VKFIRIFILTCFVLGISGLLALGGIFLYFSKDLPDVSTLKDVQLQTPMLVYSQDGELISQFGEKRRIPLAIEEIPQDMLNAFLAIEDTRFYSHPGIDFIGITRAVVSLVATGEKKQGASTITQQVARNFFLSREKRFSRKIREIVLAWRIEQLLSKDEILELYLNKIPLGYRSFGVGAAAAVYYGKTVDQLSLAEIAVIAGLPKAPSRLNPIYSADNAIKRRNVVLRRMRDVGFISETEYREASRAPNTAAYHGPQTELDAPYIAEMVRQEMVARYGEEAAYTQGFRVYTTVNSAQQRSANHAVVENLLDYDQRHGYRGPLANPWMEESETEGQAAQTPPWSEAQVLAYLKPFKQYAPLKVGFVLSTDENNQAAVLLRNGEQGNINWDGMKWARSYIDDQHQGAAPTSANEIMQPGDVIMLRETQQVGEYTLSQLPTVAGALVALKPGDGAIQALVGGFNYHQSQFNRVVQAKRQIGSNIKPFIYSAALELGDKTLASLVADAPINRWDPSQGIAWRPKNSPARYDGDIRLRMALAKSKNVVSVRLVREMGVKRLVNYLSRFGFEQSDISANETIALGSASFTPLEVARGFATFANHGYLISPYLIDEIRDASGNRLFKTDPAVSCDDCETESAAQEPATELAFETGNNFPLCQSNQIQPENTAPSVISKQNAFLITQAMNSAIHGGGNWSAGTGWNGTGWRAAVALKRRDIAGKTGTTNEAKDAWFSGFHPELVVTSWIGFDNHTRTLGKTAYNNNLGKDQISGKEFGAKTALPAWNRFMKPVLSTLGKTHFTPPDNIVTVRIDRQTGLLTQDNDSSSRFEYFIRGTEPTRYVEAAASDPFEENGYAEEQEELF